MEHSTYLRKEDNVMPVTHLPQYRYGQDEVDTGTAHHELKVGTESTDDLTPHPVTWIRKGFRQSNFFTLQIQDNTVEKKRQKKDKKKTKKRQKKDKKKTTLCPEIVYFLTNTTCKVRYRGWHDVD